jgi:hypothetical protein
MMLVPVAASDARCPEANIDRDFTQSTSYLQKKDPVFG